MEEQIHVKKQDNEIKTEELNRSASFSIEEQKNLPNGEIVLNAGGEGRDELRELYETLRSDNSRSSDSFEMAAVKRETEKLLQMKASGASPAELLCQYRWMETVLEKKYLEPREGKGSYGARHQKVRAIYTRIRKEKKKLLKGPDIDAKDVVVSEGKKTEELARRIERSHKDAGQKRAKLLRLLKARVSMKEQDFLKQKREILSAYDEVINEYRGIVTGFCISLEAKRDRLEAERVFNHLAREKKLFENATFQDTAKHHYRTWDEGITEKKEEEGDLPDRLTNMLLEMTGASYLAGDERKKGEQVTYQEAVALSKAQGRNLCYSADAIQELGTIQILDMIAGQKGRNAEGYYYTLEAERLEGEDYLFITHVSAVHHTNSFGTDTFAVLNQNSDGEDGSYTRKMTTKKGTLQIGDYDVEVADAIIDMDEEILKNYFSAGGLGVSETDALMERFQKVRTALIKDREKGRRADLGKAGNLLEAIKDIEGYCLSHDGFYGDKNLLRDNGDTKAGELSAINDQKNNSLKSESNRKSAEKSNQIKTDAKEDLEGKFGYEELPEETEKILGLIRQYGRVEKNKEFAKINRTISMDEMAKTFYPKKYREIKNGQDPALPEEEQKKNIRRILKETYFTNDELLNRAEEEPLEKLRPLLKQRIDVLSGKAERSEEEQTELNRLSDYQERLFAGCDGSLTVPEGGVKIRAGDGAWFERDIDWKRKEKAPLFCHEPRISDVCQTNTGDCYFLSTLAATVEKDPEFIKRSMRDNGNGTVTVRFFRSRLIGAPEPIYVTVDKSVPGNDKLYKSGAHGALWVKLYEKAFLASGLKENRWFTKYNYRDIEEGSIRAAVLWIRGKTTDDIIKIKETRWIQEGDVRSERYQRKMREHIRKVRNLIFEATERKQVLLGLTFASMRDARSVDGQSEVVMRGIVTQHGYTILGLERIGDREYVKLRNPWGQGISEAVKNVHTGKVTYRENQKRSGVFYLDLPTFCKYAKEIQKIRE